MKGHAGSFIALLSNLVCGMMGWSFFVPVEPANLAPSISEAALDRSLADQVIERTPQISALDPQEARRRPAVVQPTVRNREAVLLDPQSGRELVDRAVARTQPNASYLGHGPVG